MIRENQDYDVQLTGEILGIERDLEPIIDLMNRTPLQVDLEKLGDKLGAWALKVQAETKELETLTGLKGFRANSSADCLAYFTNKGFSPERTTSKGRPSMDKEVLQDLVNDYPVAEKILKARESIAIFGQLRALNEIMRDGRDFEVQPKWNQLGTPMGRLSCEGIAIQNRVQEVQECFVPHSGYKFLSMDISQAEYVGWASLSKDPALTKIFANGEDLHTKMGELIAGKVRSLKGHDMRKIGKTINFALLYLMKASTLARMLGCSTKIAEEIIEAYEDIAITAVVYRKKILRIAGEVGAVSTVFGRIRKLPGLQSADQKTVNDATKTAWHHHNAGSVADLMKLKWVLIERMLRTGDRPVDESAARWVMNRHDELILEVKDDPMTIAVVKAVIDSAMALPVRGFLPLRWEIDVGSTWASVSSE